MPERAESDAYRLNFVPTLGAGSYDQCQIWANFVSFQRSSAVMAAASALFATLSVSDPMAANAKISVFKAILDGPSEAPPVDSPGTGTAFLTTDDILNTIRLQVSFSDLIGGTTVAHIHAPTPFAEGGTAGVATTIPTFPLFPTGVTSGTYDQTFDMLLASSYNPNFINSNGGSTATAQAALFSAIFDGKAYLNIHTTEFGGGRFAASSNRKQCLGRFPCSGWEPPSAGAAGFGGVSGSMACPIP